MILTGILFPLIVLPFVSGYNHDKGFIQNLLTVGIAVDRPEDHNAGDRPSLITRIVPGRIPYRFVLAFGVVLVFAGYLKVERQKQAK